MKKKISVSTKGIFLSALAFTVISAIFRTLSMLLFFDSDVGYFRIGAVFPVISNVFLGAGIIGFLALAIGALDKKDAYEYKKAGAFRIVACALATLCTLTLSVSSIPAAISGDKFATLCAALAFTGALYFPCICFMSGNILKLITGACLVARFICMMGVYYFNQDITMNAPDKIIFCLACAFAMWLIPCEIKATLGVVRPWIFTIATVGAASLAASASIPSIIKLITDRSFKGMGYTEYAVLLAVSVYALAMLSDHAFKPAALVESESTVEEMTESAEPDAAISDVEASDE